MATAKTPKSTPAAKATASKPTVAPPTVAGADVVKSSEIETAITAPTPVDSPAVEHPVEVAAAAAVEAPVVVTAEITPEVVAEPVADAAPLALPATLVEFPLVAPVLSHVVEPALKGVDELLDFGKANAEAVVAASHSMAIGLQTLVHDLIEWSQHSLENGVATGKALSEAGSVQDALELSQSAVQQSLEKILNQGSQIGTRSTKLIEESFAPLRARVEAVVEKLTSHAA